MADSKHLPFELLDHIVSFLPNDVRSLSNLSRSCRVLDVISKPHLFSVLDFRRLSCTDLTAFRRFVKELHITWQLDMLNGPENELLERLLIPYLSPDITPRLQSLVLRGISSRGTEFLSTQGEALGSFTSLTSLTLWETHHPRFRDVQELICALPHLKTLRVHTVSWNQDPTYVSEPPVVNPDIDPAISGIIDGLQGPKLDVLRVSPTFPEKTLVLLRWLAATPSQDSLKTLDIPYAAHQASAIVPLFGPSVASLVTPVRLLQASSVERYTALTSLTLLMHKYHPTTANWKSLPIVLSSLPSRALLRTLILHVELKRLWSDSEQELSEGVIDAEALREADRVLFAQPAEGSRSDPESITRLTFAALQEVRFAVRPPFCPSEGRRVAFEEIVGRLMSHTCTRGLLEVTFEV